MAKLKMTDAPGCVGSVLIRKEDHPICRDCMFTNICARLAERNEERLLKSLGIEKISRDTGKKLMKGAEKLTIAELESPRYRDKKPLTREGIRVMNGIEAGVTKDEFRSAMTQERRTFVEHALQFIEPDWVRELLVLIWENKGEVKKKDLRDYLIHDKGIKTMTAGVYVANFVNAVTNMDLFTESPQNLKYKETVDAD
ncbi:MAG: hypothetical protein LPK02_07430 [Rhodobacterales bacterium]|nr:hypothetical protein [Rhodobacterales bacterium]